SAQLYGQGGVSSAYGLCGGRKRPNGNIALIHGEDEMKVMNAVLTGAALFVLSASAIFAKPTTTTAPPQTIQQRKENQQDRIGQGVQSGQLTAGETKNLETKEAGMNQEEGTKGKDDNGI